jgi:putative ABC transport system permease protein
VGRDRLFRLLLRAFPRAFRARYGEEMTELYRRRIESARARGGALGALGEWLRSTGDVLGAAVAERVGMNLDEGGDGTMGTLLQDLRYAGRRLVRTPWFSLAAIAILAVGIGANAAAFSAVDALVFRPPPYADPDQVVSVYQDSDEGDPSSTAYPAYRDIAQATDVFAAVGAVSPEAATWEAADGPQQVAIEYATASFLPVLGLSPSRGRWFTAEEDQVGAGLVAVVSAHSWRARFGADPSVIGRTIRLNGQTVTIVGVGPERFNGSAGALVTDFWLSISSTPVGGPYRVVNLDRREDHWYDVKARLAPGVPVERARAAMSALALRMGEQYPELDRGRGITVFASNEVRFHPEVDGVLFGVGAALLGVVGLVLILACSNLANLILARGASRASEMAVRQALGASRGRLTRLFLAEAVLLAALGGAAGLVLARGAVALFPLLPIDFPGGAELDLAVDHRVTAFGALIALATALAFGLAPAIRARKGDVASAMREEGRGASPGRGASLTRKILVGVQVAISLVLITGAGLAVRSLARTRAVDPGFDVAPLAVLGTNLEQAGIGPADVPTVRDELIRRIAALPGVTAVSFTTRPPAQPGGSTTTVVEGFEPTAGTGAVELAFAYVGRDYFATLGLPLLAGRAFGPDDVPGGPRVAVMNEAAARRFWSGDGVGKRLRPQSVPDAWRTVVGVVGDAKVRSLQEEPTPMMYLSAEQSQIGTFTLVVRSAGDPADLLQPLRAQLAAVAPAAPVVRLGTMDEHLGGTLAEASAATRLLAGFSLLALVLASLGVYAMVAFSVAARTAEMGIRTALGAGRSRLVSMVVAESLVPVGLGLVIGLAAALALGPLGAGLLYGIGARDPATVGGAVVLLALVAAAASAIPAWRAAAIDPVQALRAD